MLTEQIMNDREYRETRAAADRLTTEIAEQSKRTKDLDPHLQRAMHGASQSRLDELRQRIAWYENLQRSSGAVLEFESLDALPTLLVHARIAANLTQRQLAETLGVSEQQVQKDEKGGYAKASFERLMRVARALGLVSRLVAVLPNSAAGVQTACALPSVETIDPVPHQLHSA